MNDYENLELLISIAPSVPHWKVKHDVWNDTYQWILDDGTYSQLFNPQLLSRLINELKKLREQNLTLMNTIEDMTDGI